MTQLWWNAGGAKPLMAVDNESGWSMFGNTYSLFNEKFQVLSLGKTRGLGYDIQSVIAEPGDMAEFVKYIEVKSTKRLTCPDINDDLWIDTLNITRNEWVAAQQHRDFYSIFRVYFTRDGISMFMLKNPMQKYQEGKLQATPMTYRVDFSNVAVDAVITGLQREGA